MRLSPADPSRRPVNISPSHRIRYATVTCASVAVLSAAGLLGLDVYMHYRVQDFAGVNVWGYRGPVIGKKRPDEIRTVMIGGSTAFCVSVSWNEAISYYLERDLNRERRSERRFSVVNLGAPGEGAYAFRFELADYAYLQYDLAIFYEGYNDLGARDLPGTIPPRSAPNYFLWRRQSPLFRLMGYFPILPLALREKAMALMAGGDLDAAYRERVTFKAGPVRRATADALQALAAVADRVGAQLGRLSDDPARVAAAVGPHDLETWQPYISNVTSAVEYARARGTKVLVVTQPYGSDTHVQQQRALALALAARFGRDGGVRYVNLGPLLNIRDPEVSFDGLHLVAKANELIASHLVKPLLDLSR